eukprot:15338519-Ditylum_brightwellii.AAC.1
MDLGSVEEDSVFNVETPGKYDASDKLSCTLNLACSSAALECVVQPCKSCALLQRVVPSVVKHGRGIGAFLFWVVSETWPGRKCQWPSAHYGNPCLGAFMSV